MTNSMRPEDIVEVIAPIVEQAIASRVTEIYEVIEDLRQGFQATVGVLDGNDQAIIAALQEVKAKVTGEGYQVAEVLKKSAESWDRFVRGEAEKLGWKVVVPKAANPVRGVEVEE